MQSRVRRDGDAMKRKVRRVLFILSFILIPVVHFLVFYIYVNFDSLLLSFQTIKGGELTFCAFDNFKRVFDRIAQSGLEGIAGGPQDLGLAFRNTFITFGITVLLFPIGMLVSYFIYKKIVGYKVFRVLFYLPAIISPIVMAFFYSQILQDGTFMTDFILYLTGKPKGTVPLTNNELSNAMVLAQVVWLGIPNNMILWSGALARIPDSIVESARMDGAGWVREMFQMILPLVWPTFVLLVITSIANCFGATGSVFLLTSGDYGTQTLSNWMYMQVQTASAAGRLDNALTLVSAMGVMISVIAITVALLVRKFLTSRIEEVQY